MVFYVNQRVYWNPVILDKEKEKDTIYNFDEEEHHHPESKEPMIFEEKEAILVKPLNEDKHP